MTTKLLLVRHGEPELKQALLGKTDSPLSALGFQQLTAFFKKLGAFDRLISSPLLRCKMFSTDYCEKHDTALHIEPQLREFDFGDWDGMTYQDLHQTHPEAIARFFSDPANNSPPNGESLCSFSQRVESTALRLIDKYQNERLVVLCHAGVIRTLVAWCLAIDYQSGVQFQRFNVDYGSVTELQIFHHDSDQPLPQLVRLNHRELVDHVS